MEPAKGSLDTFECSRSNEGDCRSAVPVPHLPTRDEGNTMQKHALTLAMALLGIGIVGACGSDKTTTPSNITYTATLAGANEKPNAVTSNGTGTFTGTLNPTANTFAWTLSFSGLTSNS